jgi:DNA-binding response OmpR family regulator
MHAMVIEDESLIAMAVEDALRACGFTSIDFAISADEALDLAQRKCPDLITADVELRPGCGITAVQSICSKQPIPVIFITGSPAKVRIQMPDHELIEEPFSSDSVIAAIKLSLERRDRPARQLEATVDVSATLDGEAGLAP